jgi:ABC-type uncharacterized transport system auxiliary subunit
MPFLSRKSWSILVGHSSAEKELKSEKIFVTKEEPESSFLTT